ncbi:SH3 domain-containing protein [Pseudanabaenaceae cyanobacterium LEGE 13415]|nr:SH3 domain-containing protein [Pseudanabaenaceae cyanobacterium LEGE 13415]
MNVKLLFSAIASFGLVALSSLPAFARDAVLTSRFANAQINLRSTPSVAASSRGFGIGGDRVRLLDQRVGANRNLWYYVQTYRSGIEGWVDGTFIRPISGTGQGGPRDPVTINARDRRFLVNHYEVKVYTSDGQTRLNAFNRRTNQTELRGEPVNVRRSSDGVTYTGRNVVFFLNNNGERTLSIY